MSRSPLHYLEAIIRTGSIAAASKQLFLTQPSLSLYVKRLEEEYEIKIFDRGVQPWKLTPEGKYFIERQQKIDSIERERRKYFDDLKDLKTGDVVIGSTQYRSQTILAPILSEFWKKYPGIKVQVKESTTKGLVGMVSRGEVDCAFIISSLVPKDELDSVHIYDEHVVCCTAEDHPLAIKDSELGPNLPPYKGINFSDCARERFIVMENGQVFHDYFVSLCAKNRITDPNVVLETQSITTIPALIRSGIGIGLLPDTLLTESNIKGIHVFSLNDELPVNRLSLAWSRKHYLSKAVKAFIKTSIEESRKTLPQSSVMYR